VPGGGAFLIEEPGEIFTPERFTAEQRQMADAARDYLEREVRPHMDEIEAPQFELTVRLLKQAGALGMLGAELPEAYGGLGLDLATGALMTETVAPGGGFALTVGAHTGIGTLPIAFFGSEAQKAKWLPLLASGEKIAAYALTEPTSGSDALAARTVAVAADGAYRLTGTKQFITNSGFADVFVVYAKIDGERFSAFIVERDQPGVSLGPEEQKMGLHGSSTRQLRLDGAVGELLGEAGRGHVIAFNILNIGRFKLGAGCLGTAKHALGLAAGYAAERVQFGKPIASFGLIQEKLAAMNARIFALESMVYRTAALMEARLGGGGDKAAAIAEFALECSADKVYGSECLDLVVDEAVQIHGGNGFIRGYEVERLYRDARINRIFEGTNEINRLLIPDQLLRRAMSGKLPLLAAAEAAQREVAAGTVPSDPLAAAKRTFLMVAGAAALKFGTGLAEQEELLRVAADAVIDIFAAESARARAAQTGSALQGAMASLLVEEACAHVEAGGREAMSFLYDGDARVTALGALRRLGRREPVNAIALRRDVAQAVLAAGGYAAGA
jgi:alkylation response protein AidB-like acyl-CoA dehydrogenase